MIKWFSIYTPRMRLFLTHPVRVFWLNQRVGLFCFICEFLPANVFGHFLFDSSSFIETNFDVRNSLFKEVFVWFSWLKVFPRSKNVSLLTENINKYQSLRVKYLCCFSYDFPAIGYFLYICHSYMMKSGDNQGSRQDSGCGYVTEGREANTSWIFLSNDSKTGTSQHNLPPQAFLH